MSDMPGPRSTPSPSNHEQHDELLVAQLASGDLLDPAQRQEAQQLVAGCPACAALAADLSAISRAVAWEPVPPRRRDFRFDAERAAQLRGSRLQRLLRRVSLPQSAALRPVAAGVMSIGLLVMVAGAVWPQAQPPAAPLPGAALSSAVPEPQVEAPPAGGAANVGGTAEDVAEDAAKAVAEEEPATAAEEPAADAFFMEAAPEPAQADVPAAGAEPEMASEAESGSAADPGPAADDATERAKALSIEAAATLEAAALAAGAEIVDSAARSAVPEAMTAPAPSGTTLQAVAEGPAAARSTLDSASAASDEDDLATSAGAGDGGPGVEDVLMVVGLVLAGAGVLLLLVVWLARRVADPLLR
jgi:hypothetical protein